MINQCYHKEDISAKILYWFLKSFLILDFQVSLPFLSSINRSHISISSSITAWTCHSSSSPTSLLHRVTISLSTVCPVFAKCPTWERQMTKICMLLEPGRTQGLKMGRDDRVGSNFVSGNIFLLWYLFPLYNLETVGNQIWDTLIIWPSGDCT